MKKIKIFIVALLLAVSVVTPIALAGYGQGETDDSDCNLDYESVYQNTGLQWVDTTDPIGEVLQIVVGAGSWINGDYDDATGNGVWLEVDFEPFELNATYLTTWCPKVTGCWVSIHISSNSPVWVNMTDSAGFTPQTTGLSDDAYLNLTIDNYKLGEYVSNSTNPTSMPNATLGWVVSVRPLLTVNTDNAPGWGTYAVGGFDGDVCSYSSASLCKWTLYNWQ